MRRFKIKLFALPTDAQQTEAPTVPLAVARAASSIDTAEMLVLTTAKEMDLASRACVRPSLLDRAHMRGIVEAREAARELMSVPGSSAFPESSPLQRIWRDAEIAVMPSATRRSAPRCTADCHWAATGRQQFLCD